MNPPSTSRSLAIGVLCGFGAAVLWAAGFVAARHGIDIGFTPADLTFHRCFWAGIVLLPLALRGGIGDLYGIGWGRGIILMFFGGLGLSFISYSGFLLVPLGHGGIIQPSTAAVLGLVLSTLVLHERLPPRRVAGALAIVAGLVVIGGEAVTTIGVHGLGGDLLFALAGSFFAIFGMLLRKWRVDPTRATIVVSVISLIVLPIYGVLVGVRAHVLVRVMGERAASGAPGPRRGPAAIYLFTRAVVLLGAGRAAVVPTLVPPCVLLIGWIALGIVPSILQLIGLTIVLIGFRLTQRS